MKNLMRLNSVAAFALLLLLFTCHTMAQAQHTVTIKWVAPTVDTNGNPLPTTGAGSITGYVVLRGIAQTGPFTSIGTPTAITFTDSTLPAPCPTAGCTLWYEVEAVSSVGTSAPLGPSSAIIPIPVVAIPGSPSNLAIVVN